MPTRNVRRPAGAPGTEFGRDRLTFNFDSCGVERQAEARHFAAVAGANQEAEQMVRRDAVVPPFAQHDTAGLDQQRTNRITCRKRARISLGGFVRRRWKHGRLGRKNR